MPARLRVDKVLEEKGLNPTDLSRRAEMAYNTVQKMVKNPYHDVSLDTLNRVAKALGVKTTELLEDYEEEEGK
ncbi:helix-turn-helix domain-containing protein [Ktedonospora formicarum]|uniref:HTH cro/C1-type domain-containing protein n=1 Tax=Ktedonospora formicarum TaxID=2778364 RepID=A0A8J3HW50_9CHLR|nr:helix-turn-helix transcriptional regulator [Ktedonospora formicarum]GHO45182.1 hypothetical protein KSX_33450 [Ktedonospora formicarum]